MKKKMIFVICGILVLSLSLCACSLPGEKIEDSHRSTGRPIENEDSILTLPSLLPANEFTNENNMVLDPGNVVIRPRHMYWDGDVLVAECFISNGLDTTVYNLKVEKLIFENEDGKFADGAFGVLEGASIAPGSYIIWTFSFSGEAVKKVDADLTGRIHNEFGVTYSY